MSIRHRVKVFDPESGHLKRLPLKDIDSKLSHPYFLKLELMLTLCRFRVRSS